MWVTWGIHRALVAILVLGGLGELAHHSGWAMILAFMFLIFATAPVAGMLRLRAEAAGRQMERDDVAERRAHAERSKLDTAAHLAD